ncbi:MAG: DUF2851 family protein [Thermomicrobiales bacterium]|nr:DUF2851 family protein [Thermomicrobiales bacterium]
MTNGVSEFALSRAWGAGAFPGPFHTADGRAVEIVHRGAWSNGIGPDFIDAMLLFDGRELRTGAVEMHLTAGGWTEHGHHLDSAYNAVILHVVLDDDGAIVRRADGVAPPLVVVDSARIPPADGCTTADWRRFGVGPCAEDLARSRPDRIRRLLWDLGDRRLAARSARLSGLLSVVPPGEALWTELLDGLGYAANRAPMRAVAAALPLAVAEAALAAARPETRLPVARALLLGVAGFLPLAPTDAAASSFSPDDVTAIERQWRVSGGPWIDETLPPTSWARARVRPANHPAARLAAAAALLVAAHPRGGLLATLSDTLRAGGEIARALCVFAAPPASPGIGADRATEIVASALLPFAFAYADWSDDTALADAAGALWEAMPAPAATSVTRRAMRQVAGEARLGPIGARGAQGLIHLDATLCAPRRCFECPIAQCAIAAEEQG